MSGAQIPGIALVGCGHWGRNLVRNFHALGVLKAVSDRDEAAARGFADNYGVAAHPFDAILTSADIEGVVIAAPAESHAVLTQRALGAGKHVFVEKPIALRVEDGARSVALAAERQRILMVGHLLRYHPAFLKLKELVAERGVPQCTGIGTGRAASGSGRDPDASGR